MQKINNAVIIHILWLMRIHLEGNYYESLGGNNSAVHSHNGLGI